MRKRVAGFVRDWSLPRQLADEDGSGPAAKSTMSKTLRPRFGRGPGRDPRHGDEHLYRSAAGRHQHAVLSHIVGSEYPLAGIRRERVEKARDELAAIF